MKLLLAWLLFRTDRWQISTFLKSLKIRLSMMKPQACLPAKELVFRFFVFNSFCIGSERSFLFCLRYLFFGLNG